MNPEIEKKYQRLRSFFFGLCILAAGLLFLITAKNVVKSLSAEHWQVHTGVLTNRDKSTGGIFYRTRWLKYTYEIDGKKYQGTRVGYGISSTDEVQVTEQAVRIYVNPDNPADAVLVTGFKKTHFFGLSFSVGFLWLGFYLWRKTE